MPKKLAVTARRTFAPASLDDPPLLRLLLAETTRRGETLAGLAKALGITYERLAQYRRGDGDISKASRATLEKAARWLGVPTVLVLALARAIRLDDFVWPGTGAMRERVASELASLSLDAFWAGLVPPQLQHADPAVQRFVALLYREVSGNSGRSARAPEWMRALHAASVGNAEAQSKLSELRRQPAEGLF